MANSRVISSSVWEDDWFGPLSFFEQTLWIGLFSRCADDQGRLLDNTVLIRAAVFPYKDIDLANVEQALAHFETSQRIHRYEARGKRLIQIRHWWKHQPQQWASASKWPAPPGWIDHVRTRENGQYVTENWRGKADNANDNDAWTPSPECAEDNKADVHLNGSPETRTLEKQGGNLGGHIPIPDPIPDPVPVPEKTRAETADDESPKATDPPKAQSAAPKRRVSPEQRKRKAVERGAREHFERATGISIPEKGKRSALGTLWWNPIREICGLVEHDMPQVNRLIDESLVRLKGLTVSDPNSILKTARAIAGEWKRGESRASPQPRGSDAIRAWLAQTQEA